jgi:hypothetical protein
MINVRNAYKYRDTDLKADIFSFITKKIQPDIAATAEQREQLRHAIDVLFSNADRRLPNEIRKYDEDGEAFVTAYQDSLPDPKI